MHALRLLPLLAALALGGCASTAPTGIFAADAPRALPAQGPVSVAWSDPARFSEFRSSVSRWEASQTHWLQELAEYLRRSAEQLLPPGQRLELTILDVDRAGEYEPSRTPGMQQVRVVRDIYPPRMTVGFRQLDADGRVIAEGTRKLADVGFLTHASPLQSDDVLRFEKRMIDSWLRSEFRAASAAH